MSKQTEAMKLALDWIEDAAAVLSRTSTAIQGGLGAEAEGLGGCSVKVATALREALAEQPAQQEPVALKWQRAPIRTAWGDEMVVASVAIDKDHTVCLYCERDQTPKVDAMFAQRTWVGLTDEAIWLEYQRFWPFHPAEEPTLAKDIAKFAQAIEAKLKEKNNG